jgi:hypothetical protein
MHIDRPIYSSEVDPINFEGGRFYYTERNIANNGRTLSIVSNDGMYLGATLPYLSCQLTYAASYKTYNLYFKDACIEYGLDKTDALLTSVENKIVELMQRDQTVDEEEAKGRTLKN